MDRVGLFSEMGYITIGDKYKTPMQVSLRKGKGFNVPKTKIRSGTQDGYFAETYNRILDGEAYTDQIKLRRQSQVKELKKNIAKNFIPSSGYKESCGVGTFYGTLGGTVPAMSNVLKSGSTYKSPGKNVLTNPSKRGTGYGYLDVTIGEYYRHVPDPYEQAWIETQKEQKVHKEKMKGTAFKLNMHPQDFFDPNPFLTSTGHAERKPKPTQKKSGKPFYPSHIGLKAGGMKAGTFDPYPSHSTDQYVLAKLTRPVHVVNKSGSLFVPPKREKSRPVASIMHMNVMRSINNQNYKTIESVLPY